MKLTRRGGTLRLRLEPTEAAVLLAVVSDLAASLEPGALDAEDEVHWRLFPAGYRDDPAAQAEYRSLTEDALRTDRIERTRRCASELSAQLSGGRGLSLDGADGTRWLQVLTDLRLSLGTRLGITEDEPAEDPAGPQAEPRRLYYWLTALQDALVRTMMR